MSNKRHLKYLDRYTCEFDFIPNMLTSLYMEGKIDDKMMTSPIDWKKLLPKFGFGYDFGLRNMTVVKSEKETKKAKFLITFPKPKVTPDCFYAILYIGKDDYNYYTLELDFGSSSIFKEGGGIVCGQKGMKHLNYSRRCRNDLNEFEKTVQDIINGKPNDPRDMFKNFDFEEAAKIGIDDEFFKKMGVTSEQMKEACTIY